MQPSAWDEAGSWDLRQDAPRAAALSALPYLNLQTLAQLAVPPREWAVAGMMPLGKCSMLTGKGGVGKSLVARLLCTCVALGRPFWAWRRALCLRAT